MSLCKRADQPTCQKEEEKGINIQTQKHDAANALDQGRLRATSRITNVDNQRYPTIVEDVLYFGFGVS